jgi:hypothetical protein
MAPTKKTKPEKWSYFMSIPMDKINTKKTINSVTFAITWWGRVKKTIEFKTPVDDIKAIAAAEKYLSKELTQKYFEEVRHDLRNNKESWNDAKKDFKTRGDLLIGQYILEVIERNKNGAVELLCGS